MDEARTSIFDSNGASGLASGAMSGDCCEDDLTPHPDDDNGND